MSDQRSPKKFRRPRILRRADKNDAPSNISISWSLPSSDDLTLVWDDIFSSEPVLFRGGLPLTEVKRDSPLSSQSTLAENTSESQGPAKKDETEAGNNKISNETNNNSAPDTSEANSQNILTGFKLVTAIFSLLLTILCVALDNTSTPFNILSTTFLMSF